MQNTTSSIPITDIDQVAAVEYATKIHPTTRPGKNALIEFIFPKTETVESAIIAYATGNMRVDARSYSAVRSRLFRLLREASRSGGAR